jgi:hypothetical protein
MQMIVRRPIGFTETRTRSNTVGIILFEPCFRVVDVQDGVTTAVYPIRGAQYQFCNCGVFSSGACRFSTCIEPTLGDHGGQLHGQESEEGEEEVGEKEKEVTSQRNF